MKESGMTLNAHCVNELLLASVGGGDCARTRAASARCLVLASSHWRPDTVGAPRVDPFHALLKVKMIASPLHR